jgi:hypothetical protein
MPPIRSKIRMIIAFRTCRNFRHGTLIAFHKMSDRRLGWKRFENSYLEWPPTVSECAHRETLFFGGSKMRLLRSAMIVLGLIALIGCNESPPGGATHNTGRASRTGLTTPEETFRLEAPAVDTTIKQGETKKITLKMSRGKNFDQDVKLEFNGVPQGVTITPASHTFKAGASDLEVTIEAKKDAALGKHKVEVTGTPSTSGAPTSVTFEIDVRKA